MRVLVTGGRQYRDRQQVCTVLNRLLAAHGRLTIIEGGATGADRHARDWAVRHLGAVEIIEEKADWSDLTQPDARIITRPDGSRYDAHAGSRRNQKMLDVHQPDMVLHFPGGKGTADMVRRARQAGLPLLDGARA